MKTFFYSPAEGVLGKNFSLFAALGKGLPDFQD